MNAEIALFEGFDELDAVGPYEVLANAGLGGADVAVSMVTQSGTETVTGSHGMTVVPDGELGHSNPGLVVVPGGGWNDRAESGTWAEVERGDLPRRIADHHSDGATVAAVCTGGMLLARAGLLDGRPAVTHGEALADLRETDADVVDARVVDDGDLVTCGGVTAGIDMALALVEREFGPALADDIADKMEHRRQGPVHRS